MKKVLIFEDNELVAKSLSRLLKSYGFKANILLYSPKPNINFSNLKLKENKPDYAIIDGLNGCWKDVAPMIEPYNICPIIFSSNEHIVDAAKEQGFYAFNKPEGLEEMIDLMKTRVKPK